MLNVPQHREKLAAQHVRRSKSTGCPRLEYIYILIHCITLLHIYIVYTCIHNIHYITCLHIIIYNIHVWYVCVVCLCLCGTVGANWTKPNSRAQRGDRFSWSFPAAALRTGGFDNPWGLKQRHARQGKCVSKEVGELKKKNLEHRFRDFQGCPRFHMPQMWSSSRTCYRFTHRCWYQPFVHSLMLWWGWINSSALSRFFCTNVSRRIQLC